MRRPDVQVSVKEGKAHVQVLDPDVVVEVRDYDIESVLNKTRRLLADANGWLYTCEYKVASNAVQVADAVAWDLERLAEDLRSQAGLKTGLERNPTTDGFHALIVNDKCFYFRADGGGYEGCESGKR